MTEAVSTEVLESRCKARGVRLTTQRRAIIDTMVNGHGHPNVVEIHALVVAKEPRVSLSTVYRMVRAMRDAGLVEEHEFGEGKNQYEIAPSSHHDHLIDTESGEIVEFRDPEIERLQNALATRLGYRLLRYKLELYAVRRNVSGKN